MGGYIGARAGTISATVANVQDVTATDTTPEVTIVNSTHEDTDGGREGKVIFKGQQSGGEESTLAEIQGSHDGTADDEKGDLIFKTNDGSDGASPTERLRIDSDGSILTATLGTDNVHLGEGAGVAIVSGGNQNVLIGKDAGTALTTGDANVIVGHSAGDALTDADYNVAIGFGALSSDTKGDRSVAIGLNALTTQNHTSVTTTNNTVVGDNAGYAVTTGKNNTLFGTKVGDALTTGNSNVAVGGDGTYAALGSDTQGKFTTAIGLGALRAQNFTSDTASNNTAVGYFAGGVMTTGTANTFIGGNAGDDCVDGIQNVAVGYAALSADAGNNNTAVGESALTSTTGANNTAIGAGSGNAISSGSKNTILGMYNGNQDSLDIRTSSENVIISDGDGKIKMLSNPDGYTKFKDDSASFFSAGGAYHEFSQSNNDTSNLILNTEHGSFVAISLFNNNHRAATSGYDFYRSMSGNNSDIEHRLVGDGNAYADGSWNGGGADYAEYFEWADGNSDSQDRTGYTVVLDNEKVRLSTSDDAAANIIGAVSVNPSVIGDSDIERWKQKYLRNDFGAYQKETYTMTEWTEIVVDQEASDEVLDDDGELITKAKEQITREVLHNYETDKIPDDVTVPDNATVSTKDANGNTFERRKLNPDYNPDTAYVSREDRKEWATIGLMGKLRIRKGQTTGDRWIKMRDVSDTVEEWLVR